MSDLLTTPSIRVTRYLSTDNGNIISYRDQLTKLARELKQSLRTSRCAYDHLGCAVVEEAKSNAELLEERLVSLACAWGDVTFDELQKFVEEA